MNPIMWLIDAVQEWQAQRRKRAKQARQAQAYVTLNNLYLEVQRGQMRLTITRANTLRVLAELAYDRGDQMLDWWQREFEKLPRWFSV